MCSFLNARHHAATALEATRQRYTKIDVPTSVSYNCCGRVHRTILQNGLPGRDSYAAGSGGFVPARSGGGVTQPGRHRGGRREPRRCAARVVSSQQRGAGHVGRGCRITAESARAPGLEVVRDGRRKPPGFAATPVFCSEPLGHGAWSIRCEAPLIDPGDRHDATGSGCDERLVGG